MVQFCVCALGSMSNVANPNCLKVDRHQNHVIIVFMPSKLSNGLMIFFFLLHLLWCDHLHNWVHSANASLIRSGITKEFLLTQEVKEKFIFRLFHRLLFCAVRKKKSWSLSWDLTHNFLWEAYWDILHSYVTQQYHYEVSERAKEPSFMAEKSDRPCHLLVGRWMDFNHQL